ncbi:hypothetical protein AZE42_12366, partial [Rhizopogon vesiculosus]
AAPLERREENLDIGSIVGSIIGDVLGGSGGGILKRDLIDGLVVVDDVLENPDIKILIHSLPLKPYSVIDDVLDNPDIKILSPKRELIDVGARYRK